MKWLQIVVNNIIKEKKILWTHVRCCQENKIKYTELIIDWKLLLLES